MDNVTHNQMEESLANAAKEVAAEALGAMRRHLLPFVERLTADLERMTEQSRQQRRRLEVLDSKATQQTEDPSPPKWLFNELDALQKRVRILESQVARLGGADGLQ